MCVKKHINYKGNIVLGPEKINLPPIFIQVARE